MEYLIKIVLILIIELNLYYFIGYGISKLKYFPNVETFLGKYIIGFVGYHVLFWGIAFPCSILDVSLTVLMYIWLIVLLIVVLTIVVVFNKSLFESYVIFMKRLWEYKLYVLPCILLGIFVIYYVMLNGQVDIDARTYIGEVTTIIANDRLVGVAPTTGWNLSINHFKNACSMFSVNSAVICKFFNIHPLIFCRTVRAMINITLIIASGYELLKWIYEKSEHKIQNAIMTLMLAESFLFLLNNTIYTSSTFILKRAYEGKAYCSCALILIVINFIVALQKQDDKRYFVLLFLSMIASVSISASAVFVIPVLAAPLLFAHCVIEKKWKYYLYSLLALSPNIIYILIMLSGFRGFVLEG